MMRVAGAPEVELLELEELEELLLEEELELELELEELELEELLLDEELEELLELELLELPDDPPVPRNSTSIAETLALSTRVSNSISRNPSLTLAT